jgi:hypothetical protein
MNVFFSTEAQAAVNAAEAAIRAQAESLLGAYSAYANRHALPGKSTLKNISRQARELLALPAGTQIFCVGESRKNA